MHRTSTKNQRRALWGWIKWAPVVAIPFSVLFFHAWLNVQILRADYVLRELSSKARELDDQLAHTDVAGSIHEAPEILAERAELLDFVPPGPGQREAIPYDPAVLDRFPEDSVFEMARLDGAPDTAPAAPESRSNRTTAEPAYGENAPLQDADTEADANRPDSAAAPVRLEIESPLEPTVQPEAPAAVEDADGPRAEPVVLDLPDDAYVETPVNLVDAGMGSLESL